MYAVTEIVETWEVAENVKAFRFRGAFEFTPGQFVMVWLPGIGEKPFSLADRDLIVVKKVGPFTSELFRREEGERLWIRGPYGKGFTPAGKNVALIAGGIGIPPMYALSKVWREKFERITLIYGARRSGELALLDVENYVDELIVTTDDGSAGIRGFPTDVLKVKKEKFDQVYACGPEPMLEEILRIMDYRNVQVSMERHMKCGIGVCGSCNLGKYLVCRDGPVFRGETLRGIV
ncbi:dihydroorotate dehydrogenase electron transfer subunit [Thermococcus waiotapuensis]|uniref:Probable dihydroorotate dehydrogenase B (NAD(+)), electron transfer subunit n=1 Tax=Thermococcus waiotapuensis TaxID=90909 RepID=A0AAE4NUM9_9EURY|nr:dihydroorotate dehydrogenase electron transfer subunit [Thermococcus waiotapuensis]MDV3104144.1 dihydroorotate dehydrogenase electron transfer subunit [Thermococcus waiotapuensis]